MWCRILLIFWMLGLASCGGSSSNDQSPLQSDQNTLFSTLDPVLSEFVADNYVFILGDADGRLYSYTKGNSSSGEVKLVASYSKWLASAAIMTLIEQGVMSLDDHPQQYITWWTDDPNDSRSQITLEQLLSFTSGFSINEIEYSCVKNPSISLEECVMELYQTGITAEPGTQFNYGPAHLQVAAYMAQVASGQAFMQLFDMSVAQPLGLTDTRLREVTDNPYVSAGFRSTGADSERFLRALLRGDFLSAQRSVWDADRTGAPVTYGIIPAGLRIDQSSWRYALGHWRECADSSWSTSCENQVVVSSPGALGWYPWIDYEHGYYAVIGYQADVGDVITSDGAAASLALSNELRPLIEEGLQTLRDQ
ncbi:MAG: serine hydrolase domain-containing protein [Candidatus Thiodiazotropha sp.]